MSHYGDCVYCGGLVEEKKVVLDYRYHGQLFIVENVPVGVCLQCGERYLTAAMSKKLEKMASMSSKKIKTVAIPVLSMAA